MADISDPKLQGKIQDLADYTWLSLLANAGKLGLKTIEGIQPPFDTMDGGDGFKHAIADMLVPILEDAPAAVTDDDISAAGDGAVFGAAAIADTDTDAKR